MSSPTGGHSPNALQRLWSEAATRPLSRQFWVSLILAVSCVKIAVALLVLGPPSLGPDEVLYVQVLDELRAGADPSELGRRMGYGVLIVTQSAVMWGLAWVLTDLGLGTLSALRLTAVLYSTASAFLLLFLIMRIQNFRPSILVSANANPSGLSIVSAPGIALLIFLLLPSFNLWSSLALREAPVTFFGLFVAAGVMANLNCNFRLWKLLGAGAVSIGVAAVFLTRSYTSYFLVIAILAISLWWHRGRRPTVALALVVAALIGVIAGQVIRDAVRVHEQTSSLLVAPQLTEEISSASPELEATPSKTPMPVISAPPEPPNAAQAPVREDTEASQFASEVTAGIRDTVLGLSDSRAGFMVGANSAYSSNYCADSVNFLEAAACEFSNLPRGIFRFIAQPLLTPWERPATASNLLAGIENYVWLMIIGGAAISVVGKRQIDTRFTTFLGVFILVGITAYALISGNAGTAFRHKSQFLWALCLIIASSSTWRPWLVNSLHRTFPRRRGSLDAIPRPED